MMKNVFLIFICASLFELNSMEKNLNSLPDELFNDHMLPVIIPGWYGAISGSNDEERLYNAVQIVRNQNASIAHIALLNKHFCAIVVPHYTEMKELINNIENSTKMYSLLGLLNCFEPQALQPITIAFKRENEWWKIEKEELMQVQFSHKISADNFIMINISFKGSTEIPIVFHPFSLNFFVKKNNVKIADLENTFLLQLSKIICTLSNNTRSQDYKENENYVPEKEYEKILRYFFNWEHYFSVKDAILLCTFIQSFVLKSDDVLPKNDFELLCQKFKDLF